MYNFIIIYTYPHGLINVIFCIIIMFSYDILHFQIINTCVCTSFETDIGRPDRSSKTGYLASLLYRSWYRALSLFEYGNTAPEATFAPGTKWSRRRSRTTTTTKEWGFATSRLGVSWCNLNGSSVLHLVFNCVL